VESNSSDNIGSGGRQMNQQYFENDYNLGSLQKINPKYFDFEFFVTPRFIGHYTSQVYEEMTSLLIRQMAKGVSTFIDVGAHYGFYDVLVGKSNKDCFILAFEPIDENFEILKRNISLHDINATIKKIAISNISGIKEFEVSQASDNSGFKANPNAEILQRRDVKTETLDNFISESLTESIMIKIVVEGSEIDVLKGMRQTINNCEDLRLFIEFNPKCLKNNGYEPVELLQTLTDLGLRIYFIDDVSKRIQKYHKNLDWQKTLEKSGYCNLYCCHQKNALNIVFFSHSSFLAGAERSLFELISGLITEKGTICSTFLPSTGKLEDKLHEVGCSTFTAPLSWWCTDNKSDLPRTKERLSESYSWIINNSQIINDISPDILFTSTLVIPWGAIYAKIHNLPHLWMVNEFGEKDHNFAFTFPFKNIRKFMVDNSDLIITCSNAVRTELFPDISEGKAKTIYYSFEHLLETERKKTTNSYLFSQNAFKLINTSTIMPTKGQEDAVKAVIELTNKRNRNVELILVGYTNEEYKSYLNEIISKNEVQNKIKFLPFLENVYQTIENADVLLVCSKNEAFGRVTVEGMILKKVVIGTNTGGTKELINHGITGLTYEPGSISQLADNIERLIDDQGYYRNIAKNGYNFAKNEFTNKNFSGKYYLELIKLRNENPKQNSTDTLSIDTFSNLTIRNQKSKLADLNHKIETLTAQLTDRDQSIQQLTADLAERDQTIQQLNADLAEREQSIQQLTANLAEREQEVLFYALSKSWRITRPLRIFMKLLRGK
jgi:FkbM family methyltransferase